MGGGRDRGADGFRDFAVARSPTLARTAFLLAGERATAEALVGEVLTALAARWPGVDAEAYCSRALFARALRRPCRSGPLAGLSGKERAVVVLRFYEDRTESQAAHVLGWSVRAVRAQTRHALARLHELSPDLLLDELGADR